MKDSIALVCVRVRVVCCAGFTGLDLLPLFFFHTQPAIQPTMCPGRFHFHDFMNPSAGLHALVYQFLACTHAPMVASNPATAFNGSALGSRRSLPFPIIMLVLARFAPLRALTPERTYTPASAISGAIT